MVIAERPGLVEARKVEKIQEIYLEALQAYVMNHRARPMTEFAKLLSVLTELRTLGNLNSEMCFSLKLKNKKLPPFLAEIWDVHAWTVSQTKNKQAHTFLHHNDFSAPKKKAQIGLFLSPPAPDSRRSLFLALRLYYT